MTTWESIVQHQIVDHQDDVAKLTRPLKEHFGITFFNYHRIDNDGKYSLLLDRPDWAEHYVSNSFYLNDPFLQHPDNYQTGSCFLEVNGNETYQNTVVRDGVELFGVDTGLIHIYRSENCVEFYCYSGNSMQSAIKELAMHNREILFAYERYFWKQAEQYLTENHEQGANLRALKGEPYDEKVVLRQSVNTEECTKFLSELGMERDLEIATSLTSREKECLRYLLDGMTAKETGVQLKISSRTVETYFDQIKFKYGCQYKHQLLPIARRLNTFGLLSP